MQLKTMPISLTVAFSKDAFPTRRHSSPANPSFSLPKQAQFSCVSVQAQQAFVRFCGREWRGAQLASALDWTCVWNH